MYENIYENIHTKYTSEPSLTSEPSPCLCTQKDSYDYTHTIYTHLFLYIHLHTAYTSRLMYTHHTHISLCMHIIHISLCMKTHILNTHLNRLIATSVAFARNSQ